MDSKKSFFDSHISFQSIGFGSPQKDRKVSKEMKHAVKHHLTK